MRAAVAATVVLATVGAAGLAAGGSGSGAALELLGTRPVEVHGTGFRSHERVRVVLRRPAGVSRHRLQAGPYGGFTTTFAKVSLSRCDGFSIIARGGAGSRARITRRPPLGCPPP
jgi:hypothetical protein